jgi:hypothetical protein
MVAQVILLDPAADAGARLIGDVGDVVHPFVVEDCERHAEHRRGDRRPAEDQRKGERGHGEIGDEKPDRQEQEIEPVGLGVMIVVQAMLQLAHERKARRLGVEAEAVEAVFADVERQGADRDPEQREWDGAGGESGNERCQAEREPEVGAMPQEGADHRPPPNWMSSDIFYPKSPQERNLLSAATFARWRGATRAVCETRSSSPPCRP